MEDENGVGDMQQPDEETVTGEDANESGGDSEDAAVDYRRNKNGKQTDIVADDEIDLLKPHIMFLKQKDMT